MIELMDDNMKKFAKTEMRKEVIRLMQFYKEFPILK